MRGEDSPECINDTILILIPKVTNPTLLTKFRLASKIIANRLKQNLTDIISEEQSTFVLGRMITDNIISAYELLYFMKCSEGKS